MMGITRDEELERIGLAQKEHAIQTMNELLDCRTTEKRRGQLIEIFVDSILGVARGIDAVSREGKK